MLQMVPKHLLSIGKLNKNEINENVSHCKFLQNVLIISGCELDILLLLYVVILCTPGAIHV